MKITRAGVDRSSTYLPEELSGITVGFNAWDGQVGQGTVPCPDPAGNQEPSEGEQLLLEQGATTILDGFVGQVQTARGPATIGVRRVHSATIGDDNALLQGHASPGWARPAEAPADRWAAFVDDFLPGSIDVTWLLTTHESGVTLAKKTYRTDSLFDDLLADTVAPTGKTVYVENRRFHWHLPTEGQTCSIVIHDTNTPTSTSFQPLSVQRSKDGMDLRNRIFARNDAGIIVSVSDPTSITAHDAAGLAHEGYSEYGTDSAADMTRDIGVTLAERKDERVTWTYDIGPLTAAQAAALIVGSQMTVTVGLHGLSAAVKRIASVKLTYLHPGQFMASIELGYPKRFRRKPTKTTSSHDSTGGSGVAGSGGGSGCSGCCCPDPWNPGGCQNDCSETFDRVGLGGLGTSELVGNPEWQSSGTAFLAGGKAVIPAPGNAPWLGLTFGTTIEILVKQDITRGTTANSSTSVNPLSPAATDHDVASRLTLIRDTLANLGIEFVELGLIMDHGAHGGILAGDLYLEMDNGATNSSAFVGTGLGDTFTVWTRFRVEPLSSSSVTIKSKAWIDGSTEPGSYMLSFAASWITAGVPHPITPNMLVLDQRVGADESVWAVDSICFIAGIACGPASGAEVNNEVAGMGDGSTTAFAPTFGYKIGSMLPAIDNIPQLDATATDGTSVTFARAPETDEEVSFIRYVRA